MNNEVFGITFQYSFENNIGRPKKADKSKKK